MRAVIQRVSEGSVSVAGEVVGSVGEGMVVLLGVGQNDGDPEVEWISSKIAQLRFFEGPDGRMNQSVEDIGGGVLLTSPVHPVWKLQEGNRPSFSRAGNPGWRPSGLSRSRRDCEPAVSVPKPERSALRCGYPWSMRDL